MILWMRIKGRVFEFQVLFFFLLGNYLFLFVWYYFLRVFLILLVFYLYFYVVDDYIFFFCSVGRDYFVFCVLVNGEGEVIDFFRLFYFIKRRIAWREEEREKKVSGRDEFLSVYFLSVLSGDNCLCLSNILCKILIVFDFFKF